MSRGSSLFKLLSGLTFFILLDTSNGFSVTCHHHLMDAECTCTECTLWWFKTSEMFLILSGRIKNILNILSNFIKNNYLTSFKEHYTFFAEIIWLFKYLLHCSVPNTRYMYLNALKINLKPTNECYCKDRQMSIHTLNSFNHYSCVYIFEYFKVLSFYVQKTAC